MRLEDVRVGMRVVVVRCDDTPWLVGVTGEVVSAQSRVPDAHPITVRSDRLGHLAFEADELEPVEVQA